MNNSYILNKKIKEKNNFKLQKIKELIKSR
jgi:hypothetical protein